MMNKILNIYNSYFQTFNGIKISRLGWWGSFLLHPAECKSIDGTGSDRNEQEIIAFISKKIN